MPHVLASAQLGAGAFQAQKNTHQSCGFRNQTADCSGSCHYGLYDSVTQS